MSLNLRGKYSWRCGVTSYLLPSDLLTNVKHIAGQVDDVQLLFFESAANANLAHPLDIAALQEIGDRHGLSYTVHLPTDIRLGAVEEQVRQQGIDEIEWLVAELESLGPICYDLHLNQETTVPNELWLENLAAALSALQGRLGEKAAQIAIENIDYPLEQIWALISGTNYGLCLDMGHIMKYGHDWQTALTEYLPAARHIHYHGVRGCRDHQSITAADLLRCRELGAALYEADFSGVVTLELYSFRQLVESSEILEQAWESFLNHKE